MYYSKYIEAFFIFWRKLFVSSIDYGVCTHCNSTNTLRRAGFIDKSIDVAKVATNPIGMAKMLYGFSANIPGTFNIGPRKDKDINGYTVCNHCGKFSAYCKDCEENFRLSSRPSAYDTMVCPRCQRKYWYEINRS